jgi:hypothetical protein
MVRRMIGRGAPSTRRFNRSIVPKPETSIKVEAFLYAQSAYAEFGTVQSTALAFWLPASRLVLTS